MPTGYTYPVEDGDITELSDFAATCAHAFGAFAHQRDSNSNKLVYPPEPTDSFYREKVSEAELERQRWVGMTEEQRYAEWSDYYNETLVTNASRRAEILVKNARYYDMLAKVQAVDVPSQLQNFKDFMVNQLTTSIINDGDHWYHISEYVEWVETKDKAVMKEVQYYSEQLAKEWAQRDKSIAWIDLLAETYGLEIEK